METVLSVLTEVNAKLDRISAEVAELKAEVAKTKTSVTSCHTESMGVLEIVRNTTANTQTPIGAKPPKTSTTGSRSGGKSNSFGNRRVMFKKWYLNKDPILNDYISKYAVQMETWQLDHAAELNEAATEERKKGKLADELYKLVDKAGEYKDAMPLKKYYDAAKAAHTEKQKAEITPPGITSTQAFAQPSFESAPLSLPPSMMASPPPAGPPNTL